LIKGKFDIVLIFRVRNWRLLYLVSSQANVRSDETSGRTISGVHHGSPVPFAFPGKANPIGKGPEHLKIADIKQNPNRNAWRSPFGLIFLHEFRWTYVLMKILSFIGLFPEIQTGKLRLQGFKAL
jgi:hypothetical protein